MSEQFNGRPIIAGDLQGEALVTRTGFNTLVCFYDSLLTEPETATCSDAHNLDLFGKSLTGKIICLPQTIGSTSAGATWLRVCQIDLAPKAMLFSKSIDSLAAAGLILADVWAACPVCTIDRLGERFLQSVETGSRLTIHKDGTVIVHWRYSNDGF
ncbi:MAG: DUF126 domain-containing protein [bacterium]|nr:DUF126 domain-containing protein [bacterium]